MYKDIFMNQPTATPPSPDSVEYVVRRMIEEVTGNSFADAQLSAELENDLSVSPAELIKIVKKVEEKLDIVLTALSREEILKNADTVHDIVEIVEEEYEY